MLLMWTLRQFYSSDCERLSSRSILFFVLLVSHYQSVKDFSLIYCTSNLSKTFVDRKIFTIKSAERLSQQVICNSFWRQSSTRSISLRDSSTTSCKSITSSARYSTILIDVRWKFWSSEVSDRSELESAILLTHRNKSTTSFRFRTSWLNFVLILNAFAIRKSFKAFWLNFEL